MSNLWIDQKYINMISSRLERFKQRGTNTWNFRCPRCGDSKTNKNKARGYIFLVDDRYIFKCHNCGEGLSLRNFIKTIDPTLHDQYVNEHFVNRSGHIKPPQQPTWQNDITKVGKRRHQKFKPLQSLKQISQLPIDHPARKYVVGRQIPVDKHWRLYYTTRFNKWINSFIPQKLSERDKQPRLVIPFIDQNGYVFAVSGRSFDPKSTLKYILIKFDDSKPKIYGLDTIDWSAPVKIVEGPLDSLFLKNAIAFAGTDGDLSFISERENCTIVLDNQPRNIDVVNKISKFIKNGWKVCIWPQNISCKDINDVVIKGEIAVGDIDQMIDNHTYFDLVAQLKLSEWRRC